MPWYLINSPHFQFMIFLQWSNWTSIKLETCIIWYSENRYVTNLILLSCQFYIYRTKLNFLLLKNYLKVNPTHEIDWLIYCQLCKLQKGCTRLAVASVKVYQLRVRGRWFSPGTPASSNTKTGRHDIAEILLKVPLNTINQSIKNNIFT
jgi:hypothetical protein